ncbi:MAG: radical SAM protein [Phycisphaerae bacterium]|nr:radical SAM protein [Phycisphaerae bacterium]
MSHVFGPVPSRRLGRSLGVDVVPFKTCTYDCIYCQLGRTTCKTVERKEWVPLAEVLADVRAKLSSKPDYITLSGSGEPTLFARLGELIDGIKRLTNVPVALLTNGSLLWQADVRESIRELDLLIPSLDASDQETFERVNGPHEAISFDRMIDGLLAARQACRGQYWLEVFLLAGLTDGPASVRKLAEHAARIRPDRIQLNTVTRPPADRSATGIARDRLIELAEAFDPTAEVIADYRHVHAQAPFSASREEILDLLRRRPCSIDGIARGLGLHPNEVVKHIDELQLANLVETTWTSGVCYYKPSDKSR